MVPVAASEGDEVMPRDAAAVATFSFCSRPTDGAAPLKPRRCCKMDARCLPLPPTCVHLGGSERQNGGECTEERLQRRGFLGGGEGSQPQEQQSN